jgi:cell division protein FtsI (penicillin-binding protein 3)
MSYGYAVGMTAINIVSFYNTIANGGKQMRPRLVKAILDNDNVIKEYPTEVINRQLFPKAVADTITGMLVKVVNGISITVNKNDWRYGKRDGTGKAVYSEMMTIAGKTGTAKAYEGNKKLMSFCGFFPAEAPEYTLIVQMMYDSDIDPRSKEEKATNNYGGGSTSALAFKEIAEKIMTGKFYIPIENAIDKQGLAAPRIKRGNIGEADYLLTSIGTPDTLLKIEKNEKNEKSDKWGDIRFNRQGIPQISAMEIGTDRVPDVEGMGAKDAVYLMNKAGLRPKITGYGKVTSQSCAAGQKARPGTIVTLTLNP